VLVSVLAATNAQHALTPLLLLLLVLQVLDTAGAGV
jgi:hypothetical protein